MSKPVTSSSAKQTKQERRRDRREEQRRREEERLRVTKRNRIVVGVSILAVALVIGVSAYFLTRGPGTSAAATLQSDNPSYPVVNNIACQTNEQVAYHVHAHLSMYINGQQVQIPQGLGIASDQSCYYWLHTHDTTGVIHIESPTQQTFKLGTFFKEWNDVFPQLQYPVQLSDTAGWKVYVNGKLYNGDFHNIDLTAHELITMKYQSPNAPTDTVYNWGDL
jgi:hypothetical protein